MPSRTMIVTGAAGFIGSHLVDALIGHGYTVIGIDNMARGRLENLNQASATGRFQLLQVDIADDEALKAALSQVVDHVGDIDTAWHMAANSDIGAGVADPQVDFRDTFLTTFNLVNRMRDLGMKRIVFASTSAVYGESEDILAETSGPALPISNYGAMKLAGEGVISAAVESHFDQACLCRFPNVVGSRSTHGVIYDLVGKLMGRTDELEVLGDGKQKKPYLHVSDLVDAMMHIWKTSSDRRALFNIGPEDDGASVAFIADAVVSASGTGAKLRYTGGDRGWVGDVPRVRYSVARLKTLGWSPLHSSEAAVVLAAQEVVRERGLS